MKPKIYAIKFARVYPLYVEKAERKGRTQAEVDEIIQWLTGYSEVDIKTLLSSDLDFETIFANAPKLNPSRSLITGVICGIKVQDIEDKTTQEIRYLDKLIDELAKGKAMSSIKRS